MLGAALTAGNRTIRPCGKYRWKHPFITSVNKGTPFSSQHCLRCLSPYFGGISVVSGLLLVVFGSTKSFGNEQANRAAKFGGLVMLFLTAFWIGINCACIAIKQHQERRENGNSDLNKNEALSAEFHNANEIYSNLPPSFADHRPRRACRLCSASSADLSEMEHGTLNGGSSLARLITCSLCDSQFHPICAGLYDEDFCIKFQEMQGQLAHQLAYYCSECEPRIARTHLVLKRSAAKMDGNNSQQTNHDSPVKKKMLSTALIKQKSIVNKCRKRDSIFEEPLTLPPKVNDLLERVKSKWVSFRRSNSSVTIMTTGSGEPDRISLEMPTVISTVSTSVGMSLGAQPKVNSMESPSLPSVHQIS